MWNHWSDTLSVAHLGNSRCHALWSHEGSLLSFSSPYSLPRFQSLPVTVSLSDTGELFDDFSLGLSYNSHLRQKPRGGAGHIKDFIDGFSPWVCKLRVQSVLSVQRTWVWWCWLGLQFLPFLKRDVNRGKICNNLFVACWQHGGVG